jgi:hypothetical protein
MIAMASVNLPTKERMAENLSRAHNSPVEILAVLLVLAV